MLKLFEKISALDVKQSRTFNIDIIVSQIPVSALTELPDTKLYRIVKAGSAREAES